MDLTEYRAVIDAALKVCEEAAKLTNNTWDDTIAELARAAFEAVLPKPVMMHGLAMGDPAVNALPAWLLPLAVDLIALLARYLKK